MSRWRILVVVGLLGTPFIFLAAMGSLFLWQQQLGFVLWLPMAACFMLGYGLAWYWQHRKLLLRPLDLAPPSHWTDKDRQAWELVETRAKGAAKLPSEKLTDLTLYVDTAKQMGLELARFYHPGARDPIASLTVPEILAVVELASHDLAELVEQYVPVSHLLTVRNWMQAKQAVDWYQRFNQVYWVLSAIFSPAETGVRYAASRLGMAQPWQLLQENLVLWFYTAYVQRLGTYLIDLNSGRLRVGAQRYRALVRAREMPAQPAPAAGDDTPPALPRAPETDPADEVRRVTLAVVGQVKAGKSSFINAVLGEQRALADVLPATERVTRYELQPGGLPTRLVLLDTVGYGHSGPADDQVAATEDSARQADVVLLVLHARNPARQADVEVLQRLRQWFAEHHELKRPPVLGILTHIDLLSPALEWSPPYNWREPTRPKEHQIQQAWNAVREQLGDYLVGLVPVCAAPDKVYGIEEWFYPTLAELLDEARAVALLRCLKAERDTGKVRKVFRQLLGAGRQAVQAVWGPPPG